MLQLILLLNVFERVGNRREINVLRGCFEGIGILTLLHFRIAFLWYEGERGRNTPSFSRVVSISISRVRGVLEGGVNSVREREEGVAGVGIEPLTRGGVTDS